MYTSACATISPRQNFSGSVATVLFREVGGLSAMEFLTPDSLILPLTSHVATAFDHDVPPLTRGHAPLGHVPRSMTRTFTSRSASPRTILRATSWPTPA